MHIFHWSFTSQSSWRDLHSIYPIPDRTGQGMIPEAPLKLNQIYRCNLTQQRYSPQNAANSLLSRFLLTCSPPLFWICVFAFGREFLAYYALAAPSSWWACSFIRRGKSLRLFLYWEYHHVILKSGCEWELFFDCCCCERWFFAESYLVGERQV